MRIDSLNFLFLRICILLQSNLCKTTTLRTTQKWSSYKTQTKSGRSLQVVSFYSHCEWSINNKDLLEQRFAISCFGAILQD